MAGPGPHSWRSEPPGHRQHGEQPASVPPEPSPCSDPSSGGHTGGLVLRARRSSQRARHTRQSVGRTRQKLEVAWLLTGSHRVSVLHRRAQQPPYGTWTVSTGKHRAIKSQFAVLVLLASGTPRGPLQEPARAVVGGWQAEPSRDAPVARTAGLRSARRALLPGPMRPSDPLRSAPARLHRGLEPLPGAWCRVHVLYTRCPSPYRRC